MPCSDVGLQTRDKLETVHGTRKKNARHDDSGVPRDAQRLGCHRKCHRRKSLVTKKLPVHVPIVPLRLNQQDEIVCAAV